MNTITHCPACGLKAARLQVQGELQSLYGCSCGHSFERDRPTIEAPEEFTTAARLLWRPKTKREDRQV